MTNAWQALNALVAACNSVPGVTAYRGDRSATVKPPCAIVSLPILTYGAYDSNPSEGQFSVYVAVTFDDRSIERLLGGEVSIVSAVHAAIEGQTEGDVRNVSPVAVISGGHELPGYELTVNYPLGATDPDES